MLKGSWTEDILKSKRGMNFGLKGGWVEAGSTLFEKVIWRVFLGCVGEADDDGGWNGRELQIVLG